MLLKCLFIINGVIEIRLCINVTDIVSRGGGFNGDLYQSIDFQYQRINGNIHSKFMYRFFFARFEMSTELFNFEVPSTSSIRRY